MGEYNFRKDKTNLGDVAENKVLAIFQKASPQAYRVEGRESRWDIIVPEKNITLEVKNDDYSLRSGNWCFECYKASGDLSGLLVSEADYWVHVAGEEMYIMPRETLKEFVVALDLKPKSGGDYNRTFMWLVPKQKILDQSWCTKLEAEAEG